MKKLMILLSCLVGIVLCSCKKADLVQEASERTLKSCDSIVGYGETVIQEEQGGSYRHYGSNQKMIKKYINKNGQHKSYSMTYSNNQLTEIDFIDYSLNQVAHSSITFGSNTNVWVYNYTDVDGLSHLDSIEVSSTGKILFLYHENGDTTHYLYNTSDQLNSIVNNSTNYNVNFHYSSGRLDSYSYYVDSWNYGNVYFYYDQSNRLIEKTKVPYLNDSEGFEYVYDNQGYLDTAIYIQGGGWISNPYDYCQCGNDPVPELDPIDVFDNPLYYMSASSSFGDYIGRSY